MLLMFSNMLSRLLMASSIMLGRFLRKFSSLQQLVHAVEHVHQRLRILAAHVGLALHAALVDLILQPVLQLLIALVGLLHFLAHLVHAVGELAGHALHEIAHLLVVGFDLFGQAC